MKVCKNCGEPLVKEAKFCSKCGTPFESEVPSFEIINSTPKNKNKKTVMTVVSVVAILGIAAGAYFFLSPSTSEINLDTVLPTSKTPKKQKVLSEVFTFQNGDQFGLMDQNLNVINENISKTPTVFNSKGAGIAYQNDEFILIDTKGEIISEKEYSSLSIFNANYPSTYNTPNLQSKNGVMDFTVPNEKNDDEEYSAPLNGLVDSSGKEVLGAGEYMINAFMGRTLTTFYQNSSMGIVSETGEIIVEPVNDQVVIINEKTLAIKKSNENSQFVIVDLNGEVIKETSYDTIYQIGIDSDLFSVTNTLGKSGLINSDLKEIMPLMSSGSVSISQDKKYAIFQDNGKYGLAKINGDILIEATYDYLSAPNEKGVMAFKDGETFGLVNIKKEIINNTFNDYVYPTYQTNLFTVQDMSDDPYVTVYNSEAETIFEGNAYTGGNISYPEETYILPLPKDDIDELSRFMVFNKDGEILSEEATFIRDLGELIFIQENEHVSIAKKKSGDIVKEKEL